MRQTTKWRRLKTLLLGATLPLLACSGEDSGQNAQFTQLSQELTFVSSDGLISMEAEHYTNVAAVGAYSWAPVVQSAASSGSALIASPNNGTINNTGYTSSSPRLDFVVNFSQAGTYQVWVRGRDSGAAVGDNDSVHVGLDGQALSSADRISSFANSFGWSRATMDNVNATIQVGTAGQHTVNVWMREDGFVLDKLVLTTDANYTPSGNGPAETSAPTVSCGDNQCNGSETCSTCAQDCGACATCSDGIQNGSETGTDCGGSCAACPVSGALAVWAEAESGVRSGSPGFSLSSSTAAAGGQYLSPPSGSSANAAGTARATFSFNVAAGTYKLWGRVITPNADDDSFWVSVDGGTFVKWNSIPASSSWAWDDVHNSDAGSAVMMYNLSAGTHSVVVANREDGTLLDKLYLTSLGDTPTGFGGANPNEATCTDGIQNQGETGVDCGGPCTACSQCTNGQTQPGSTVCGLNGRGVFQQLCSSGQWGNTTTCLDADSCVDGSYQDGSTPCGPNGRGTVEQVCNAGQWQDSASCVDDDVCTDGQVQPGFTSCGLNGRGLLDEQCVSGQWQDLSTCNDSDVCVDGSVRTGTTPCAGGGTLQQLCQVGAWTDSSNCQGGTGLSSFAWLDAEQGTLSGSPGFSTQSSATASGGQYLLPPTGTSANAPGTARATFTVNVAAGTYALWARVITPNADDDSFWVSVDGGTFVKWNSIPASSTWAWARVYNSDAGSAFVNYTLTAGTHTVVFANREDGAQLDKIYLTQNGDTPSGLGGGTATCSDGIQNQGETGVDCGGPCAACPSCGDLTCSVGESCSTCPGDCGACFSWSHQDIGAVGAAGGLTQSGSAFTVTGSGDDIHSTHGTPLDEFHFVYQPISGDGTIVARVVSVQNTDTWAKGGVMIRESLSADARFALVARRPDGAVQAQFRAETAQTGTDSGTEVGGAGVKWLMVERVGNQFRTFYSTDGVDYTQVGTTTTIAMTETVYLGLAVTSHNDGVICSSVFDQVSVITPNQCGDAICDGSEDCSNCALDCGACGPCGDAICDAGENCTSCAADCGQCSAVGLDTRPLNATCVAPPALSSTVAVQNVWSGFTFNLPMQVLQPPGESTRLIVVERNGRARSAPFSATSSAQATTFLQLSNVVTTSNGGFLSMAFHPNWTTNRYAYVVYTTSNRMKRISRFQSTDGGLTLNPATEQLVFQQQHLTEFNHNGGQIAFGKDGYLYMSTGDDAYLDYQRARHSASTSSLFGKVLRFDVNGAAPYAIPPDNPFVAGGGLPEIYAYGLRNPWRFSFDRLSGDLWLADVGENTWEEINIIRSGQFYGWPYREADVCFTGLAADCATPYTSPEYKYSSGSASVSGGFVYRGAALAGMYGKYIFGDYQSGQVSVYDPVTRAAQALPGTNTGGIVGFGEDNQGELYVVRLAAGRIEKLVPGGGTGASDFPALLSDTGCFSPTAPTQVRSGVIPYSVAQPFWSDGVAKERYLALPDGTQITIESDGDWELPPGGVTIKNFRYQGKLFETRFFVRHSNGTYSGYTYQWNDQETQATLVPPSGATRSLPGLSWSYPSRGECFACHTAAANYNLGIETRQLNVDSFYPTTGRTANQLTTLDVVGMLTGSRASMTPFPAVNDNGVSLDERASSYLHVNCSNCHRPGGPGGGPMDLRYDTPLANKRLCDEPATLGSLGLPDPVLLYPGDHMSSVAWLRMSERGTAEEMPPIASTVVDAEGAALLQAWIDSLMSCP